MFHRNHNLPCLVLRTSRFFLEEDDNPALRLAYDSDNVKVNEFLNRRVDIHDVVEAHLLALEKAPLLGFGRYIISATTPFQPEHLLSLTKNSPEVVRSLVPGYEEEYSRRAWKMFPSIERVYVNERARRELGWRPRYDFQSVVELLKSEGDFRSPLARAVGSKGYHPRHFERGPYPAAC